MSNVAKVEGLRAPMGQFVNIKRYPPADFRAVSAPNVTDASMPVDGGMVAQ